MSRHAAEVEMSLQKPEYVSDLVVYLLNRLGVEYVTLNPGATTRGMHESLVTYGGDVRAEGITSSPQKGGGPMAGGHLPGAGGAQAPLGHNTCGPPHAGKRDHPNSP